MRANPLLLPMFSFSRPRGYKLSILSFAAAVKLLYGSGIEARLPASGTLAASQATIKLSLYRWSMEPSGAWVACSINLTRTSIKSNGHMGIAGITSPLRVCMWFMLTRSWYGNFLYATHDHRQFFIASSDNPIIRIRHIFEKLSIHVTWARDSTSL